MTTRFSHVATKVAIATSLILGAGACSLDRDPPLNEVTTIQLYQDPANYQKVMAKLYASLILTGQAPTGIADISAGNEGYTSFYRSYWNLQETGSDLIANGWHNDPGIPELSQTQWTPNNPIIQAMFTRIYFEVNLCNEYLRNSTDDKLNEYGISGADAERARQYRNDARFLRAFAYYYAVDMFGNAPLVTESDPIGYYFPKQLDTDWQAGRRKMFEYVESELKAVESSLPDAPEYGRAGKGAAQAMLAHLYLNAEVYTGQARYTDCITYCNRVMQNSNYSLADSYPNLFAGDNGQNANVRREIIFSLNCDGARSQTYGGTTVLVNGSMGGSFNASNKGTTNAWAGQRAMPELVNLFGDSTSAVANNAGTSGDRRGRFWTRTRSYRIRRLNQLSDYTYGFGIWKWTNTRSDGSARSDASGLWSDTDVPLLRLGEIYLTYAEAVLRGGSGGSSADALEKVNMLRRRAYAEPVNVPSTTADVSTLDLDFLLAERGRELYWEGYRRNDLIRFGKFVSGYNWTFKNGIPGGADLLPGRELYPIPASAIASNPEMRQNPAY